MTILYQVTEKQRKERAQPLSLHRTNKSAVAEHSTETGHRRKFQKTELLAHHADYTDQPV
jgi:hypothetical protein